MAAEARRSCLPYIYAAREAKRRARRGSLVALCGDGALKPRHYPLVDLAEVTELHAQAQVVEPHLVGIASIASIASIVSSKYSKYTRIVSIVSIVSIASKEAHHGGRVGADL